MAFIYAKVNALQNTQKVGDKQCVALVRHYLKSQGLKETKTWREGAKVLGNTGIVPGTAIATFVNGRYPNKSHGNHAALYVGQDAGGILVMDQWKDDVTKPRVSLRYLRVGGTINADGTWPNASNNANAFSVIE